MYSAEKGLESVDQVLFDPRAPLLLLIAACDVGASNRKLIELLGKLRHVL
jgi:hypothetical protein